MLVSYKWLNEYVDLSDVTPQELAEKLTRSGIEVESIRQLNIGARQVVVGYVSTCIQHPNADKLSLCTLDIGEHESVQIVCGAPNIAQGQKVPVAKIGAVLPGNVKIKKTKLRGEISEGMICSAQELGIDTKMLSADQQQGIFVLPEQTVVGEDALGILNLDDVVLELELTPNRSDCLSMLGVAYEVAALFEREIRFPDKSLKESGEKVTDHVKIDIQDGSFCPQYAARKLSGIKVGASPLWLQNRLIASGIRPINHIVDITNYVLLEYGQPLHAFDAKRVKDGHIIVRQAEEGETVTTLDDQDRSLTKETLVIADPEKVIALAGVMGAANSEVTLDTTEIILESAQFAGHSVRLTSRALDLRSEASLRFEKGVDPGRIHSALNRAAYLIQQVGGGHLYAGIAEQQKESFEPSIVNLNMIHLNDVLGTQLKNSEVGRIFDRLSFDYENRGHEIRVDIPIRRPDLKIEEDLMEEVARLYGYDRIPTKLPEGVTTPGALTRKQKLQRKLTKLLQGSGNQQVFTYSLTNENYANWGSIFFKDTQPVRLAMPMSEERSHLRTTVIPNLLDVALYNKNRKLDDIRLFEIGRVFLTNERELTELPHEKEVIAGVLSGTWQIHPWQGVREQVDFYVLKGIVEALLKKLEIDDYAFERANIDGYHPGRTALVRVQGETVGLIGQIHPKVQKQFELQETYAYELSLEALLDHLPPEIFYEALPKFPSIHRDIALVVDEQQLAGPLIEAIEHAGRPLLKKVHLFDVYTGEGIAQGKKSIAFSLTYQHPDKTLTDEEINSLQERILRVLADDFKADLR